MAARGPSPAEPHGLLDGSRGFWGDHPAPQCSLPAGMLGHEEGRCAGPQGAEGVCLTRARSGQSP